MMCSPNDMQSLLFYDTPMDSSTGQALVGVMLSTVYLLGAWFNSRSNCLSYSFIEILCPCSSLVNNTTVIILIQD
jgi:hypothetical protein